MLRVERQQKKLSRLEGPTLAAASVTERYDFQEFIFNSPSDFFAEIGRKLFLVGKELQPSENVQDRVDLLALDTEGNAVIIELKRGNDKLQLLQAISYAGMVARWAPERFVERLSPTQAEELDDFLDIDKTEVNKQQRIILIAEAYDYEVLAGAEWLNGQHDVDISCCRISLAKDSRTNTEYLTCNPVFPAPELAQQAIPRRHSFRASRWPDWETALSAVTNQAVVDYFQTQLRQGRECYLRKRILRFRVNGKRRWGLSARDNHAYVWQEGRFQADVQFWQRGITHPDSVKPVKEGAGLRFRLAEKQDFEFFHHAATEELGSTEWLNESVSQLSEPDEEEETGEDE